VADKKYIKTFEVDESNLDNEIKTLGGYFAYYATAVCLAQKRLNLLEFQLSRYEADVGRKLKSSAITPSVDDKKESKKKTIYRYDIERACLLDPAWVALKQQVIDAEYNLALVRALRDSFVKKNDQIGNLLRLKKLECDAAIAGLNPKSDPDFSID